MVSGAGHPNDYECSCGHKKSGHSREGCRQSDLVDGKWVKCQCKTKFTEL